MTEMTSPSRVERRKARTRAALVGAAQSLLASGRTHVAVLEITQAADVGMGSFYNHFESKDQLFEAAVAEALDAHGTLMDQLTAGVDDPARAFAQSFRLTGRLHRVQPELSRVILHAPLAFYSPTSGLAPRALRDIQNGIDSGRFTVRDAQLALVAAAGSTLFLGQLLHEQPDRDDREASDQLAEDLLRMFGVPADEAHTISREPLPDLMVATSHPS
ncbi:TetR/AcrR family transcriptional regulator [Aeromicrobium ginsengisoli]|uniref:TetR/AcrR family transcriptional regulator n=1 Tax=Aeromicrobium ginsengisoli TaxID=363867 RepID=A0A5M4FEH3_9ACTN|nr:TetR/AcrR family transcriptional regulator [Aeromicrobium ginsengisoli]KAA1397619.1 TetR/AcrR family transcriptional regulator [Aeromicrobium ginsengisoli]